MKEEISSFVMCHTSQGCVWKMVRRRLANLSLNQGLQENWNGNEILRYASSLWLELV